MPQIHDLTHSITADMPVYPGAAPPVIEAVATVADNGFCEHRLTMVTHTGTHLDAPAHMIGGGRTLDTYPIEHFVGPATVIDVATAPGGEVGVDLLEPHADLVARQAFLLLHTGWASRWGDPSYFVGYPALTVEAADWLGRFDLRAVGVDAISVDLADTVDFPVHHALLGRGWFHIENLTGLAPLIGRELRLSCAPLKLADADGAPARVYATVD